MARKYSKSASKDVERAMHKEKRGQLKSGRSGKTVTSRKQAIAIGLSEARKRARKSRRRRRASPIVCSGRPAAPRFHSKLQLSGNQLFTKVVDRKETGDGHNVST